MALGLFGSTSQKSENSQRPSWGAYDHQPSVAGAFAGEGRGAQEQATHQDHANDIQRRDVDAQEAMAFAALLQLLLTVVAIWLLKGTLDATNRAVGETSHATKAMLDANKIAEESARGWVAVSVRSIGPVWRGEDQVVKAAVVYEIKNVGSSPITAGAHSASFYHLFTPRKINADKFFESLGGMQKSGILSTGLAPGEDILITVHDIIPAAELIKGKDGGFSFECWVGILYRTRSFSGSSLKIFMVSPQGKKGFPSDDGPWEVSSVRHLQIGSSLT
ncbi:MAG: hypothetical protein ACK4FB_07270 [Brevundimonas sp.]|uniref:hypothetical protein n=1 Tax=Brevundimonas sp. TaxID=1871086 RepID=UPI00391E03AA